MKQLLDFIPLIIFFILYQRYDIYFATGALIVATAVQMLVTWVLYKKVEKMQLATFVMVLIFGGMTILFQDEAFIKWKVTILYAAFALGLWISQLMKKPLIKSMLGKEIVLEDQAWLRLNRAWAVFFLFCAVLNIYVSYSFSLDTWVNFKVFGLLGLTFMFTLGSGVFLYRHMSKEDEDNNDS
ncbi:septation protein A [Thaumasiovibrio subtropicus]|uniref:septation protein A n=1 Tax=Thaumasiovibrio subtropicus TaxID=1891207 RepID=UPI000B34CEBE|nr:septation protein A [Thaumasiovibrio subtropicus]